MTRPRPLSPNPQTEFLLLSWCSFTFWWVIIISIHLLASAYNAGYAKFYWDFDATFLSYTLESYRVGMPRESFRTIAYVHIGMAAAHGLCVLSTLVGSFWNRRLSFSPWTKKSRSSKMVDQTTTMLKKQNSIVDNADDRTGSIVVRTVAHAYTKLVDRRGLFGVNGRYFHTILLFREILETALQTMQAIRMSQYLPRMQLNRFYVGLLVVNCWSSVIIYSRWFWKDEARRRFALIACDCTLDLMSSVGVSVIIVLSYVDQYDVVLAGFGFDLLADDIWIAQMLNESQMVLVTSWSDLAVRVVFSLGLIIASSNMQELLRRAPRRDNRVSHTKEPNTTKITGQAVATNPTGGAQEAARQCPDNGYSPELAECKTCWAEPTSTHSIAQVWLKLRSLQGFHVAFVVWGFVILALHTHASHKTPLVECMPKVHPMAWALPSCFVVNFNCHDIGIAGAKQDVQKEWAKFDRKTAVKLQMLHCPYLEVPESLGDFSRLQEIRIYNSTLNEWGINAAVTNTQHPELKTVSVFRAEIKDGRLPLGLQSSDYPLLLTEIYFCETNMSEIPEDLDTKWKSDLGIYIENSQLTVVPPVLIRLKPFYLILNGNPISEIPPEVFGLSSLLYFMLGRTNIRTLPQIVTNVTTNPFFIDVRDTEVAFFWSWMDPLVELMTTYSPMILGSGSKYCSDLESVMNGSSSSFSTPFQSDYSSLLMNASELNWGFLSLAVDCSPTLWNTMFPMDNWDETYRLQ